MNQHMANNPSEIVTNPFNHCQKSMGKWPRINQQMANELRTARCGLWSADSGLRTVGCRLRTADCGLRTVDCGLRTAIFCHPNKNKMKIK